jgi:hypothetical protein
MPPVSRATHVLLIHSVVTGTGEKSVGGVSFTGFGAHCNNYPCAYLTAAAAVGITRHDVDVFVGRLDECFAEVQKRSTRQAAAAASPAPADMALPKN